MYRYTANCRCGKLSLKLHLPNAIASYRPRQCDCEFCTERNAAYLSDPDGRIDLISAEPPQIITQGSGQASFLTCASCGTLVAVAYNLGDQWKAAINTEILKDVLQLGESVSISPRLLSPEEKVRRWSEIWSELSINGQNRP